MRYICIECGAEGGSARNDPKGPSSYHCHQCNAKDAMWPFKQAEALLGCRDEIAQLNTALTIKNGVIKQLKARVAELEPLASDRQQQYDMKVKARAQRDEMRQRVAELEEDFAKDVPIAYAVSGCDQLFSSKHEAIHSIGKHAQIYPLFTSPQQANRARAYPESVEVLGKTCIDGGACHHACDTRCFRRECCTHFSDYKGPWAYPKEGDAQQAPARQVPEGWLELLRRASNILGSQGFDAWNSLASEIDAMLAVAPLTELPDDQKEKPAKPTWYALPDGDML